MMEAVADNEREHPTAPPQADPPADIVMPAGPPPEPRQPTEVTPEQIRQFQEFQRFQELMRQQAEQGMPPGSPPPGSLVPWGQPPPKQSLPKRVAKAALGKIITGLVVLAVLVLAGYLAIDYFFGPDLDQPPASVTGGGKTEDNLILPTDPYEAVRMIYHQIANGDGVAEQVCPRFKDDGKKFATDMGYDNCADAVNGLAPQVTDANAYAESMPSYKTTFSPQNADTIRISSCEDSRNGRIEGGPPLGAFTVEKIKGSKGDQWIITDHENEPPCFTSSSPPSN
jgi:hypothetical protein